MRAQDNPIIKSTDSVDSLMSIFAQGKRRAIVKNEEEGFITHLISQLSLISFLHSNLQTNWFPTLLTSPVVPLYMIIPRYMFCAFVALSDGSVCCVVLCCVVLCCVALLPFYVIIRMLILWFRVICVTGETPMSEVLQILLVHNFSAVAYVKKSKLKGEISATVLKVKKLCFALSIFH